MLSCVQLLGQQKVGLVLSGGAAKGLAHLGAIKALEENEIPIDYIVGTSMGSVIGACYAAGFSVEGTEQILLSDEFQKWVKGEIRNEYNYYFNKDEDTPAWINIDFSIDSSLNATINSSLADDLSINFVLAERFAKESLAAGYDFDSLFVPYRAVAAEVFTQSTLSLDSGNLGRAVRASMSVPFFYRPIKVDNHYLFDGGIYNNFPTSIMKDEFAPDVIIGVNVSSKVFEEYPHIQDDKLISNSLIYMMLDKSDPQSVGENGIYISPDITEYSALDFEKVRALIDSGYTATMRMIPQIKEKISRRVTKKELDDARANFKKKQVAEMNFGEIQFHGFNSKQRSYIRKLFGPKSSDGYSFDDIKTGYYRLVSEDYFKTVFPDIGFNDQSNQFDFHFYGRPRNNFSTKVGGVISTRNINHVYMGLKYARFDRYFSKTNVDFHIGNFYKSATIKSNIVLPGKTRLYVAPDLRYNHWDYINTNELVLSDAKRTIVDMVDRYIGFEMGIPAGASYKVSHAIGVMNNHNLFSNTNEINSADTLDSQKLKGLRYQATLSASTLNRPQYASTGKKLSFTASYFNVDEEYVPGNTALTDQTMKSSQEWVQAKFQLEQYFNPGRTYSYGYLVDAVVSNQQDFSTFNGTIINTPTFSPLSDSRTLILQKLRAYNYLAIGARNIVSFSSKIDFRLEGYLFKSFNQLISRVDQTTQEEKFSFNDTFFSGTAGVVYHSPIGPIAVNFNYYDDPENQFGLFVHLGYMIFKRSSME